MGRCHPMALAGGCGDNKEENTSVCRLLRDSKQFAAQLGDEHTPVHTHSTMQQHRCGGTAPCRVTCSWGQLQSLLLVPEHLFPLYGFWEMHTACDSAGRRWQGELCARRCGEGGGKRGKEGEEGDKWRGRDGGRRVGSTFCSLLPCELQPELPLVFSLTYFL